MAGNDSNVFPNSSSPVPQGAPSAPPSPVEVKVRTMRSDLESMAQSGGGLPHFETIKVAGLASEKKPKAATSSEGGKKNLVIILIIIAALVVLAGLGYFAYKMFFSGAPGVVPAPSAQTGKSLGSSTAQGAVQNTPPAGNGQANPQNGQTPSSTQGTPSFVHASFFKKPADQTLVWTLAASGPASSAADLQTFNQKLVALLAGAKKSASMVEVDVQAASGSAISASGLFTMENAEILDPAFLAAHFDPDVTFFIYRDAAGFWPGYVLSLKSGENWLFLKDGVAKLESSPSVANLFLEGVTLSPSGFADGTASSTAVRALPFSNPAGYFTYGWYGGTRLIISTSQAGFIAALNRL